MAKKKISDFRPQARNANRHTPRGLGMLSNSMSEDGWIGAITTAADGGTFDGSARLEVAYERFGEAVEPIVVESDGTRPVIVKRVDIPTADDPRAKKLSVAANRIASVDLDWDAEVIDEILGEGIDLSGMFFESELDDILAAGDIVESTAFDAENPRQSLTKKSGFVKVVLSNVEISIFERAMAATGIVSRSDALKLICEAYLGAKEKRQFDILEENFS